MKSIALGLAVFILSGISIVNSANGLLTFTEKSYIAWCMSAVLTLLVAVSWDAAFRSKSIPALLAFVVLGIFLSGVSGKTTLLGWTAPVEEKQISRAHKKEDSQEARLTAELDQLIQRNIDDAEILKTARANFSRAYRPKQNTALAGKIETDMDQRNVRIKEINDLLLVDNEAKETQVFTPSMLQVIQAHAADFCSVLCILFLSVYRRKSRSMSFNVHEQWLKVTNYFWPKSEDKFSSLPMKKVDPVYFLQVLESHSVDVPTIKMDADDLLTNAIIEKLCNVKRSGAEKLKSQAFDKGLLYRKPHGRGYVYWHVCYGDKGAVISAPVPAPVRGNLRVVRS